MADFNVRSDSVNVEQIMEQIRARIREKRGVDYTEQQIRELAAVKLEKFLDPRGVRSDLLEQFRKAQPAYAPPELPNYAFESQTLYESTRPPLRWIRKLLNPILKLFFNPNPLIQALNIQSRLNTMYGEREARREATRRAFDQLQYELMHNLVIETTRMSIEVKNLKMRAESLASRLEFNERRSRALESVVVYRPSPEDRSDAPLAGLASRESAQPTRSDPSQAGRRDSQERREGGRGTSSGSALGKAWQGRQDPAHSAAAGLPQDASPAQGGSGQASSPAASATAPMEGPGQRSRRRRRRRGRRGSGSAAAIMGAVASPSDESAANPQPTEAGAIADTSASAEKVEVAGDQSDEPQSERQSLSPSAEPDARPEAGPSTAGESDATGHRDPQ
jgi:hypothetical protein